MTRSQSRIPISGVGGEAGAPDTKKPKIEKPETKIVFCLFCGEEDGKHDEHCPVPVLTKEQLAWIFKACVATGTTFPLY